MKVFFTPSARDEFLAAIAYIQRDNPVAAGRFRVRVGTALKRLRRFPASGRPLPEFPELPHREVLVTPYRFFYRVDHDVVWIVAVWHGAQLPESPS